MDVLDKVVVAGSWKADNSRVRISEDPIKRGATPMAESEPRLFRRPGRFQSALSVDLALRDPAAIPRRTAHVNYKGGVGKTHTTCHLAGALVDAGHRILVLDLDAQANPARLFLNRLERPRPYDVLATMWNCARPFS